VVDRATNSNCMKRLVTIISTIIFSITLTFYSVAQIPVSSNTKFYPWVSAGPGLTFSDNFHFMTGLRLAINSSINQKYFLSLLAENSMYYKEKPNEVNDIQNYSVLVGMGKYKFKSLAFIASTGISIGHLWYRGNVIDSIPNPNVPTLYPFDRFYEFSYYKYIGLPIDLKILFTSPFVGLSLDLYANIHRHSNYGVVFSLNFGKIRDKKNENHRRNKKNNF